MNDSIHASGDADADLPASDDLLLAANAADIHRLLAWYYGTDDPSRHHIRERSHLDDLAA